MRKTDRWKNEKVWRCKTARLSNREFRYSHACVHNKKEVDQNTELIIQACTNSKLFTSKHRSKQDAGERVLLEKKKN